MSLRSIPLGLFLLLASLTSGASAETLVLALEGPRLPASPGGSLRSWTLRATRRGIRVRLQLEGLPASFRTRKTRRFSAPPRSLDFRIPRPLRRRGDRLQIEGLEGSWVDLGRFVSAGVAPRVVVSQLELAEGVDLNWIGSEVFLYLETEVEPARSPEMRGAQVLEQVEAGPQL